MKVLFVPMYEAIPYQKKLIEELEKYNVEIYKVKGRGMQSFNHPHIKSIDIIHFHWLEPFFLSRSWVKSILKVGYFFLKIFIIKKRVKIVWTVHNLVNHEKAMVQIDHFFTSNFIKQVDGFSVHNEYTKNILATKYGINEDRLFKIPHANYLGVYFQGADQEKIKKLKEIYSINPADTVFMFLGNIRPYKGLLDLVEAFKNVNNKNIKLLIVGKEKRQEDLDLILENQSDDHRITVSPIFVPDDEIDLYLSLADVMVYPYKDIVTSGALILGMSYKKMCIARNIGSMPELIEEKFLFNNIDELKELIENVTEMDRSEIGKEGLKNMHKVEKDTWNATAKKTLDMYHSVLNRG